MKLEGIHHITAITGDAQANIDFYAGTMGLRMVKKTVNQDAPSVYHLFYADEQGSPGSDITFFEFRGAPRGRAGAGMVHRIVWRVGSEAALDFWAERLDAAGIETSREDGSSSRDGDSLRFADPEGLGHELLVAEVADQPLIADHPEVPGELALQGFHAARAYAADPERSRSLFESVLGFVPIGNETWEMRGESRGGLFSFDAPPTEAAIGGAGTVHHVAFATQMSEQEAWQQAVARAGLHPTPVIDRFWFRSIYFREPNGVLFELATLGPGFSVDEDPAHLGESLILPPAFEHLRERIEPVLTPIENPRTSWARTP